MSTSAHLTSFSRTCCALGDFRSRVMPRLLRLARCQGYASSATGCGGRWFAIRHRSPLGGSTLMTSAPKSDRMTAALGPAMKLAKSTTFSPEKILSFTVCLVRLSKGRARSGSFWSLAFEVRLAFFAERGHALFSVLGSETLGEERRLDVQPFREAHVETPVRGFDRQFDRRRGIRIDLVQDGFGSRNEVVLGNDFVDEADPVGLLCVDHVGGENQLQCATLADQSGQALRPAIAWND